MRGGRGTPMKDIHPDNLDIERRKIPKVDVGFLKRQYAVDPGAHDTVSLSNRIDSDILFNVGAPVSLQQSSLTVRPKPMIAPSILCFRMVRVGADPRDVVK